MFTMLELNKTHLGDCLQVLKTLPENSVDSIVTDPPYELGFMGKSWDNTGIANNKEMWAECLRVLKPGGHLLAFSGTRTYHRMASAIEDAGFEVRDMIEWVYGSGFPKSLNIGKAINKIDGVKFDSKPASGVGFMNNETEDGYHPTINQLVQTGESSERAKQYEGWGTALKPAHEPICMARKPLSEKSVAENCLKWGTGGINIDESRVDVADSEKESFAKEWNREQSDKQSDRATYLAPKEQNKDLNEFRPTGRFPANLIHDNSEEVRECFPEAGKGNGKGAYNYAGREYDNKDTSMFNGDKPQAPSNFNDSGNASRFFKSIIYQAKSSKSERTSQGTITNSHPTIKPLALMEYLIKMVTPKGGIVLDPFAGSGSTLVAAKLNGFQYVGIELTAEYLPIIESRLASAVKTTLF